MATTPTANTTFRISEPTNEPWKYRGYREFTAFVASDESFFILRRFSTLSARVLLSLQDDLTQLEDRLKRIDDCLAHPNLPSRHNGSFRDDAEDRKACIKEIEEKLRRYNKLVLQHSELRSRPKVEQLDVDSVKGWFTKHRHAVSPPETEYINKREDLFAISHTEKAPLLQLLENYSFFRNWSIWRKTPRIEDESAIYTSSRRLNFFVRFFNTFLGLSMLISPLWILAFVKDDIKRLAIITTFLVCFLCIINFTLFAKPSECLAATAAYAAVLVVFLQAASQG